MKLIDMDQLKQFNPKLHKQIQEDPNQLLQLQEMLLVNDAAGKAEIAAQAMQAAAENLQYKPPKVYTMPFIWAYFTPVFTFTAAWLIKLQAATAIPWFPFFIICGFGVRLLLAPLMIRQMIVINKIGQASPNIRLVMKLFKFSKMAFFSRLKNTAGAIYDYSKQTKINLLAFYFYNLIQIPVFITMVLSIRKIAFENDDLAGQGIWWFKNLNEADPYLILPIVATILNYINLGRGITKENEHWFINRFRSFFQVLQFFHLPFTHQWPAGAFVYWISSSTFVLMQQTLLKRPWFLNKINPNFFFDYQKISPKDHENYVDRLLNAEDHRLKQYTNDRYVQEELEYEMKRFLAFQRMRKVKGKTQEIVQGTLGTINTKKQDTPQS